MSKAAKKGIASVVIICVLIASLFVLIVNSKKEEGVSLQSHTAGAIYDANYFEPSKDKAMILIPGLMASTLFDPDTGKPVWGMKGFYNLASEVATKHNKNAVGFIMNLLASDEDNIPNKKLEVGTMAHDADVYGSFEGMKGIYDILAELYGKQYDLIVWQYDWRQHVMGAAEQLELFVNNCGYDEVMFFTHSMGGVVVANYLARSEANRDKTKLFMPAGAPFLGSMDATLNMFDNLMRPPSEIFDINNPGVGMVEPFVNSFLKKDDEKFRLFHISRTFAPVYQLLPFAEYNAQSYFDPDSPDFVLSDADYTGAPSSILIDGQSMSPAEFIEWLKTQPWAVRSDGKLQPVLEDLENYRKNLFFDVDGKQVFVAELVPTEYVVGIGVSTAIGVNIRKADTTITEEYHSMLGDGTVPAYSATAGLSLENERVHVLEGIPHGPLWDNKPRETFGKEDTGLKFLPDVMAKYIAKTDAELGL